MSGQEQVVYKTPLQRCSEIAVVILLTAGITLVWRSWFPAAATDIAVVTAFIAGLAVVPPLGSLWAIRCGAPVMTRDERSRQYLAELGPIGGSFRTAAVGVRRTGRRRVRG